VCLWGSRPAAHLAQWTAGPQHTMPDADDGAESSTSLAGVSTDASFDAAAWAPTKQEYGVWHLLMCRTAMAEQLTKPSEVEHLKFVDSRVICLASSSNRDTFSSDEDISEGDPQEATEPAAWPGKVRSWWRVNSSLGEDVIVRSGVSLASPELRRVPPGDLVQQAGAARALASGRARGCVRLPVEPCGWVTADATRAGGPKYLEKAAIPRWRVVYQAGYYTNKCDGDVIVREEPALNSDEVAVLHCGEIVEQAGPVRTRPDGIVRMPVFLALNARRHDAAETGDSPRDTGNRGRSSKTLGWVTVDASEAGGPVFFKPVADDGAKRRRRPKWSS